LENIKNAFSKNMRIYSRFGGKINRVSRKHSGRAFRGAFFSGMNPFSSRKNQRRGDSMFGAFGKKGKVSF
jgi:hypothetical protein